MTNHMVIVSSFKIRYNTYKKYYEVRGTEDTRCPYCGGLLEYRNSRTRERLNKLRKKTVYLLRRLWCACCRHLHTEIPDIIQPYRHFGSSVIQEVLDGGGETCAADDSTIRRWRSDFAGSKPDIEQRLKSVYARETDSHAPLNTETRTLDGIKRTHPKWLSFVIKLLICHGHRLCTRFAFCPEPAVDKVTDIGKPGKLMEKGGRVYDKTKEDTG